MDKPPMALITHPEHLALAEATGTVIMPLAIRERDLHWALGQDWIILARDSDVYVLPVDENLQSNPQRIRRRDHGYGRTET